MAKSTWPNSAKRIASGALNSGGDFFSFRVFSFESIVLADPPLLNGLPAVGGELNSWETTRQMYLSAMLTEAQIRAVWEWAETIENGGRSPRFPKLPKNTLPVVSFAFYQ